MATIATRINSSGTYFVNGSFDEITTSTIRTTTNTVYARLLDEVTYNTSSGVVKNLLSWSEYFKAWEVGDQSGWFYNLTPNQVTFDVIAGPAPNTLAGKLIDMPAALGSQIHRIYTNSAPFTSGVTYTLSIYAQAAERTKFMMFHEETLGRVGIDVDLSSVTATASNGSPANIFITSAGNGWYRAGFTFTATQTGNTVVTIVRMRNAASAATYIGDGSSGIYVWGVQLEESSSATSYQGNGIRTSTVFGTKATPLSPGFAKREASDGSQYITGSFDEVTGAPIIDSSVVLWLDPAQPTSYPGTGTTWIDLSTSNNTGTLTSASTFDRIEGAGSFNFAITNYATLATNLVPSGSRTIVIAFKTTDITTRAGIISTRDGAGGWFVCLNRAGGGNFTYSLNNVAANNDLQATNAITQTNTWYIAIITHDDVSDVGKIYINGNLIVTATMGEILPISSLTSYVGREINSGNNFPGWIGSVIVYNRALTEDEATQNFNALRRRYGI
jgi:hypothetical protein